MRRKGASDVVADGKDRLIVTLRLAGVQPKQIGVVLGIGAKAVRKRLAKFGAVWRDEYFVWGNIHRFATLKLNARQIAALGAAPLVVQWGDGPRLYGFISADAAER